MISLLIALFRLLGMVCFTILWICCFPFYRIFNRGFIEAGIKWRKAWIRLMMPFLGVRIIVHGLEHINTQPAIYVSNHRSYIDPVVAARDIDGVVVAKAEVASWPLIGLGTRMAGVIFVQRENKTSRNTVLLEMEKLLLQGKSVLVYPEGTTSESPAFLPFRQGAFQLATKVHVPIIPIAIEYRDPEDAWIGDDTFVRHFFQTFGKTRIEVRTHIGSPIVIQDGAQLMKQVHSWIASELKALQSWMQERS